MIDINNKVCSVCGIPRDLTKFYLHSKYGDNLCNKYAWSKLNKGYDLNEIINRKVVSI